MVPPDRRPLDSRRLGAVLLDGLLLAPVVAVVWPYDPGVQLLATAFCLTYFFLCDATTGQTVGKALLGLRTVTVDGRVPGTRAAAARTVLRLVDHTLVGLLVMVCTGRRRQRLGDLAGRTCVVRARDVDVREPLRVALLLRAALWIAPALVVAHLSLQGRTPDSLRARADAVCAEAAAAMRTTRSPLDVVAVARWRTGTLARLDAPPNWERRHASLVHESARLTGAVERLTDRSVRSRRPDRTFVRGWRTIARRGEAANRRVSALGFEDCASA